MHMLEEVLSWRRSKLVNDRGAEDDQLAYNRYWLERGEVDGVRLDYRGARSRNEPPPAHSRVLFCLIAVPQPLSTGILFLTLLRFKPSVLRLSWARNQTHPRLLPAWELGDARASCFVHNNGFGTFPARKGIDLDAMLGLRSTS